MASISMLCGVCLLICGVLQPCAHAGKVLVVPLDWSHWISIKVLMMELIQRGHELTVLRPSNSMYMDESSDLFHVKTIPMPEEYALSREQFNDFAMDWVFRTILANDSSSFSLSLSYIKDIQVMAQIMSITLTALFENEELMEYLKNADFDLILADTNNAGGVMLSHYLKLPLVLFGRWMPSGDIHFEISPSPLSYVPMINSRATDRMLFSERITNILLYYIYFLASHFLIYPIYDKISQKYLNSDISVYEMYKRADMYLMKVDFVFEYPRPIMPNAVYIGGFQCHPPNPLPEGIKEFMDSSEHGVVIFSLGALIKSLPHNLTREMAKGLAQLPERVIWSYIGEKPDTLGNNTMIMSWLPQNDLLGHPNTKTFISHGGENSVYEAIYHGVPVVGFPIVGDEYENILRLKTKGAAILLENLMDLTAEDIFRAVRLVIDDPSYGAAMRQLSKLHRDTPISQREAAVFWTEFVMRHGGAGHLRPMGSDFFWYQYYLLDVIAVLILVFTVCFYLTFKFLRVIIKKCWLKMHKIKKD